MSSQPDTVRKTRINALIAALKDAGVWAKLDLLYLPAAHDAQAARLNWVSSSYDLTAVNSPTFTTDRGYAGNGTTSYLTTGFVPSTNAVAATLNSMMMGAWLNAGTDTASDTPSVMGAVSASNASFYSAWGASNCVRGRVNQDTTVNFSGTVGTRLGLTAVDRSAAAVVTAYRNGAVSGVQTTASSSLQASAIFLCGRNNGSGALAAPHDNRISAAFVGGSLSDVQHAALYAGLNSYMAAVGA